MSKKKTILWFGKGMVSANKITEESAIGRTEELKVRNRYGKDPHLLTAAHVGHRGTFFISRFISRKKIPLSGNSPAAELLLRFGVVRAPVVPTCKCLKLRWMCRGVEERPDRARTRVSACLQAR